jgi:hypothetical protein
MQFANGSISFAPLADVAVEPAAVLVAAEVLLVGVAALVAVDLLAAGVVDHPEVAEEEDGKRTSSNLSGYATASSPYASNSRDLPVRFTWAALPWAALPWAALPWADLPHTPAE